MPSATHAVVLGGSLAGMLTASVLARHVDRVTLVERDELPSTPATRKGVPQGRHAHLLMSGGARAIDTLLPGTIDRLIAEGGHRIGLPSGLVSMSAHGWFERLPASEFVVTASRALLDFVVRRQVLAESRITVLDRTSVQDLCGDATRVSGVQLRSELDRSARTMAADFVIDATGRASRARKWLTELGLPAVHEETVDPGLAYATRLFRAPTGVQSCPIVNVQANARDDRPGQTATLLPIEDGQWLVTLSGTFGGQPPADEGSFVDFARAVRHPVVGEIIADAEPISPVHGSHGTANRRSYFDRLSEWPEGFLVLGDAMATYNPVYGHGMSVAAHQAVILHNGLSKFGLGLGVARRMQRELARATDEAWQMATGQDLLYPGVIGPSPTLGSRLAQRFIERVQATALGNPRVSAAFFGAVSLSAPLRRLLRPAVLLAVLRGPARSRLTAPPLTEVERALFTDMG